MSDKSEMTDVPAGKGEALESKQPQMEHKDKKSKTFKDLECMERTCENKKARENVAKYVWEIVEDQEYPLHYLWEHHIIGWKCGFCYTKMYKQLYHGTDFSTSNAAMLDSSLTSQGVFFFKHPPAEKDYQHGTSEYWDSFFVNKKKLKKSHKAMEKKLNEIKPIVSYADAVNFTVNARSYIRPFFALSIHLPCKVWKELNRNQYLKMSGIPLKDYRELDYGRAGSLAFLNGSVDMFGTEEKESRSAQDPTEFLIQAHKERMLYSSCFFNGDDISKVKHQFESKIFGACEPSINGQSTPSRIFTANKMTKLPVLTEITDREKDTERLRTGGLKLPTASNGQGNNVSAQRAYDIFLKKCRMFNPNIWAMWTVEDWERQSKNPMQRFHFYRKADSPLPYAMEEKWQKRGGGVRKKIMKHHKDVAAIDDFNINLEDFTFLSSEPNSQVFTKVNGNAFPWFHTEHFGASAVNVNLPLICSDNAVRGFVPTPSVNLWDGACIIGLKRLTAFNNDLSLILFDPVRAATLFAETGPNLKARYRQYMKEFLDFDTGLDGKYFMYQAPGFIVYSRPVSFEGETSEVLENSKVPLAGKLKEDSRVLISCHAVTTAGNQVAISKTLMDQPFAWKHHLHLVECARQEQWLHLGAIRKHFPKRLGQREAFLQHDGKGLNAGRSYESLNRDNGICSTMQVWNLPFISYLLQTMRTIPEPIHPSEVLWSHKVDLSDSQKLQGVQAEKNWKGVCYEEGLAMMYRQLNDWLGPVAEYRYKWFPEAESWNEVPVGVNLGRKGADGKDLYMLGHMNFWCGSYIQRIKKDVDPVKYKQARSKLTSTSNSALNVRTFTNLFDPMCLKEVILDQKQKSLELFDARCVKCDGCAGMCYIGHWEFYDDEKIQESPDVLKDSPVTHLCISCTAVVCQTYCEENHLPYDYERLRFDITYQ